MIIRIEITNEELNLLARAVNNVEIRGYESSVYGSLVNKINASVKEDENCEVENKDSEC